MSLLKLLAELAPKTKTVSNFFLPQASACGKREFCEELRSGNQLLQCTFNKTKGNQLQVIISDEVTQRFRGLYCTLSYGLGFSRWFMAQARSAGVIINGKRQGSVPYSKDWENEVSKIFIISPRISLLNLVGHTVKKRPAKLTTLTVYTNWEIL